MAGCDLIHPALRRFIDPALLGFIRLCLQLSWSPLWRLAWSAWRAPHLNGFSEVVFQSWPIKPQHKANQDQTAVQSLRFPLGGVMLSQKWIGDTGLISFTLMALYGPILALGFN